MRRALHCRPPRKTTPRTPVNLLLIHSCLANEISTADNSCVPGRLAEHCADDAEQQDSGGAQGPLLQARCRRDSAPQGQRRPAKHPNHQKGGFTIRIQALQRLVLTYPSQSQQTGASLEQSYLEEGFILDKKIGVGQPKRIEKARILVANTALDTDKIKIYGASAAFCSSLIANEQALASRWTRCRRSPRLRRRSARR